MVPFVWVGRVLALSSRRLVPGDVVVVQRGKATCDMVLLRGAGLVEESMLSGEVSPAARHRLMRGGGCPRAEGAGRGGGGHGGGAEACRGCRSRRGPCHLQGERCSQTLADLLCSTASTTEGAGCGGGAGEVGGTQAANAAADMFGTW